MRKLTVLQILPALQSGGVERGTLEIASHLVAQGHRSLVMSAGGRMVAALEAAGSSHFTDAIGRKSLLTLLMIPKLRALWRREQVDIVHVRSRFPAWVVYLAWKGMPAAQRPRLVTTVHGYYRPGWYSRIMTCGERVIVISKTIQAYAQHAYQVDPQKMQLIYRGVDTTQYRPGYQPDDGWRQDWFAEYPHTRGKRLLVLPARISRWKGATDFVEMLRIVCQQHQDVHALLVGEVAIDKQCFAASLQQKIHAAGLAEHITLTGYRQDVKQIMAIANIVYSLSTEPEAFGRTTLEALSLGVPVIGYAHGGVAEQLAALLPEGAVPVGNVAEVAMLTLSWLAQAPTVLPNTQFSLQVMQQKTLAVYQDVMADAGRGD
ncbi:glycosyltransferase family 4 protein [Methylophilus sp. 14]|uniref:glycosyltransferase family 4 protein n=1 Tax=Methylophilus sp. 14 TaxID=2781019 RepID=UPI00188F66E1|nr:glycosyltransferase family 4 protein [Methylophilus sp. 14]MBF4988274.1 glycosyltransferase family 4 protein [Methylophilus sp. 14]